MEEGILAKEEDAEIPDASSVLSDVGSELFTDFDLDGSKEPPPNMQGNILTEDADISDSDTSSILSSIPSELFADFDLDGSFLASCSDHLRPVTNPNPARTGNRNQNINESQYSRLSDPASNHKISLGLLSNDYQQNMSEANSTIVVDTSPRALTTPRMSQARRRSSTAKKNTPTRKKSTPVKKSTPIENSTPSKNVIPQLDSKQRAEVLWEDAETETEEEIQGSVGRRRGSRTRKRKRAFDTDEGYDEDYMASIDSNGGKEEKIGRLKAAKGHIKARAPVMGKFNVSGLPCTTPTASSSKQDTEQAAAEEEDDPWEAEPFHKEYEEAMAAKVRELQQLSAITEFPPPSNWYAGVPKANSQWTVCIRPPKPTWYHPDWDAERRKQADKVTAELVRKGEQVLREDMKDRRYEYKKTGRTLVTKRTVTWYQCHWFPTGKRWVFNISLDGYDEY